MFENLRYKMDVKKVKTYFETSTLIDYTRAMLYDAVRMPDTMHWLYQKPKRMLKAYTKDNDFWFSIHVLNGSFWEYTNYKYRADGNHIVVRSGKYPAVFKYTK